MPATINFWGLTYHEMSATVPSYNTMKFQGSYLPQNVSYYQWMSGTIPRNVRYISYSRYTWNCQVL